MITRSPQPAFDSIGEVALKNASLFGDRLAFQDDSSSISFRSLAQRMRALCNGLRELGLKPGDRIAFLCKNRIACIELFLAAEMGIVVIPINWRLTPNEIAYILQDSRPTVFLTEAHYAEVASEVVEAQSSIRYRYVFDAAKRDGWLDYDDLFLSDEPQRHQTSRPRREDPACIVYTSGTTGKPKGAVLSHGALLASSDRIAYEMLELGPDDVTIAVMPLFHVGGMWFHCFPSFAAGATTILQSTFRPEKVLSAIVDHEVTNIHLAPTMVGDILDEPKTANAAEYLKRVFYAASPMPGATLNKAMKQFPKSKFYQSYGSTEAGPICWLSPDDHVHSTGERARILTSCGRAFDEVSVRLIADSGNLAEPGEIGEIEVRSAAVMSEYWQNPNATHETLRENWLATGDLGWIDEDGYIYIADRKKNMIISGGENVYPIEVENVLLELPEIAEVAVIGAPDDRWVERVVACVVLCHGSSITSQDIIAHAKKNLSGYKCPKEICFLSGLPKNAAGKVVKRNLVSSYPFN
jgi:acyl-CoA synthetase (AMP-forming)/AMP-acid ligase II